MYRFFFGAKVFFWGDSVLLRVTCSLCLKSIAIAYLMYLDIDEGDRPPKTATQPIPEQATAGMEKAHTANSEQITFPCARIEKEGLRRAPRPLTAGGEDDG